MVHTAVFALIGVALLSLAASYPTPDYRLTKKIISDIHLKKTPGAHEFKDDDLLKPQAKQGFGEMLLPFAAAFFTPLLSTFGSGLATSLQTGLTALSGANRTGGKVEAYVVNSPESSVPYLYITQSGGVGDSGGVLSSRPPGVSLVPPYVAPLDYPYASPFAVPYPYPGLVHGNVQHLISNHQILVPLSPSAEKPKDDVKSLSEPSVDVPSDKSEVSKTSV